MKISKMRASVQEYFVTKANEVARETGMVKRASKISGALFLQIWVFGFIEQPRASLNQLCEVGADLGVSITKQGLQERLMEPAVEFMKKMFGQALEMLQQNVPLPLTVLRQFTGVYLLDSTTLTLPEAMSEEYRGCGGSGSNASLKLQTMWEMVRGQIDAIWLTAGRRADQGFKGYLSRLVEGSLFIADLGYYVLDSFDTIARQGGYFLSRFNKQTGLINPDTNARLDLLRMLQQTTFDQIDMQIELGIRLRLPCRMIAVRLPTEIVAERVRKAKATAKRKGRTLSDAQLHWLKWSIYITNVPASQLTLHQVVLLYTVRWQIELLFKLWKSEGQLHRIAGKKRERILCEIYAKLIGFTLFHALSAPFRWAERELSPLKAFHIFQRFALRLAQALNSLRLICVLKTLTQRWQSHALKDRRRKRLSTLRQIAFAAVHAAAPRFLLPPTTASPPPIPHDLIPQLPPELFWSLILLTFPDPLLPPHEARVEVEKERVP